GGLHRGFLSVGRRFGPLPIALCAAGSRPTRDRPSGARLLAAAVLARPRSRLVIGPAGAARRTRAAKTIRGAAEPSGTTRGAAKPARAVLAGPRAGFRSSRRL